jgi:hypothetical protein
MKNWKLWLAGILLVQLLVVGVDVVMLWPTQSYAEQAASQVKSGMTEDDVDKLISSYWVNTSMGRDTRVSDHVQLCHRLGDGSILIVTSDPRSGRVVSAHSWNPVKTHPLTRLRRTLAHLIPALKE